MVVVDLIVMAGYTGLCPARVLRLAPIPRQQEDPDRSLPGYLAGAGGSPERL